MEENILGISAIYFKEFSLKEVIIFLMRDRAKCFVIKECVRSVTSVVTPDERMSCGNHETEFFAIYINFKKDLCLHEEVKLGKE